MCRPRPLGLNLRVPDRDLEDLVILNAMGDLFLPQGRYAKKYAKNGGISLRYLENVEGS